MESRRVRILACLCGLLFLSLSACAGTPETLALSPSPSPVSTPEQMTTAIHTPAITPSPTPTYGPRRTATATLRVTRTPSRTPTRTPSSTPTITPTPTHPLMIESLRQGLYPGSEVVIEETLAPGVNYNRYIASYRSEGLKIYALLTVPGGEKPVTGWPVVIFNHGYIPPEQYRTTERYVAYVDGFARNGYIVFRSDYRGHGSSEGEPRGPYDEPDYTIDVLNAVAAMKAYPDADPERIGMWGHSMGGSITLQVMVTTRDVKAGVIWAGMVGTSEDILEWRRRHFGGSPTPLPYPSGTPRAGIWGALDRYGTPEENPLFWDAISPTAYLGDISGPLQLHHGTADTSVPFVWSENLYAQMQSLGLDVEFYSYPNDNHNLSNNFGTAMAHSIEFFDRYLKDPYFANP